MRLKIFSYKAARIVGRSAFILWIFVYFLFCFRCYFLAYQGRIFISLYEESPSVPGLMIPSSRVLQAATPKVVPLRSRTSLVTIEGKYHVSLQGSICDAGRAERFVKAHCPIKCFHVEILQPQPTAGMSSGAQGDQNSKTRSAGIQILVNTSSLKVPPV